MNGGNMVTCLFVDFGQLYPSPDGSSQPTRALPRESAMKEFCSLFKLDPDLSEAETLSGEIKACNPTPTTRPQFTLSHCQHQHQHDRHSHHQQQHQCDCHHIHNHQHQQKQWLQFPVIAHVCFAGVGVQGEKLAGQGRRQFECGDAATANTHLQLPSPIISSSLLATLCFCDFADFFQKKIALN